jgi:hypothetical protein
LIHINNVDFFKGIVKYQIRLILVVF